MENDAGLPMYGAYKAIAEHYGVKFVMRAEEPGTMIYVNTDTSGTYFTDRYKVWLGDRPADGSLDGLFESTDGEGEAYFDSEETMLEWFRKGGINADSLERLQSLAEERGISIYRFANSYTES